VYVIYLGVCLKTSSSIAPPNRLALMQQAAAIEEAPLIVGTLASDAVIAVPVSPAGRPESEVELAMMMPSASTVERRTISTGSGAHSAPSTPIRLSGIGPAATDGNDNGFYSRAQATPAMMASFDGIVMAPLPSPGRSLRPSAVGGGHGHGGRGGGDLSAKLDDLLHLHGKKGWRRVCGYWTAPLVLLIHATMPSMLSGTFGPMYAMVLSAGAPFFFLLNVRVVVSAGLTMFLIAWAAAAAALFVLIQLAIKPLGGLPSTVGEASMDAEVLKGFVAKAATAIGNCPGFIPMPRSRLNLFFACMALVQSIVWLNAVADEVVAFFGAVGDVYNVRQDLLGATVLAWGETVPELVALSSLARNGETRLLWICYVCLVCFVFKPLFNLKFCPMCLALAFLSLT
jgi:Ca2+/Na+ antiporter